MKLNLTDLYTDKIEVRGITCERSDAYHISWKII